MDVFELRLMLSAELADRRVIDGAAGHEPHEIDGMPAAVFDRSRTAEPARHGKQQHFAEHSRMNRGLPFAAIVSVFPRTPVEFLKNLVEQSDGMIVRNPVLDRGLKQHNLLAIHRRRLPVVRFYRFFMRQPRDRANSFGW